MYKKVVTFLVVLFVLFGLSSCATVDNGTSSTVNAKSTEDTNSTVNANAADVKSQTEAVNESNKVNEETTDGTLTVIIDVPEEAHVKKVHVSVKEEDMGKDKTVIDEFDLDFLFNWRKFDKFSGTDDVPFGKYLVVADFFDNSGKYLFSKEVGQITSPEANVLVFADEKIIDAPELSLKSEDDVKYVVATPDRDEAAVYYTMKSASEIPDDTLHIEGTRYTAPVEIKNATTVRAVAVSKGMIVSRVEKQLFDLEKLVPPVASYNSNLYEDPIAVKLSHKDNAAIYYTTDGKEPTKASKLYANETIPVDKNTVLKAFATSDEANKINSDVVSYDYKIKAKAPVSSLQDGLYKAEQVTKLSTATPGCDIYYTLDGSTPTVRSNKYSGSLNLNKNTVVKAIAVGKDYVDSDVSVFDFKFVNMAKISADPAPGTYPDVLDVKLISSDNSSIYYTTDGTEPTTSSKKYGNPVTVDENTVIKAIAAKDNFIESDSSSFDYKLKVATPTADKADGEIVSSLVPVKLNTATKGASIKYSLNNSRMMDYNPDKGVALTKAGKNTIEAQAFKDNWIDSDIMNVSYNVVDLLTPPVISLASGTYRENKTATLSLDGISKVLNADIYYTMDNSVNDRDIVAKGTKYQSGSTITIDKNCILRAVAAKENYNTSSVAVENYEFVVKDVSFMSLPIKEKSGYFKVEIGCDTEGAVIYYTTNGKAPTSSATKYTGPFEIAAGTEIQAFAAKEDWLSSGVISWKRKI